MCWKRLMKNTPTAQTFKPMNDYTYAFDHLLY